MRQQSLLPRSAGRGDRSSLQQGFLFSPAIDLIFVANLYWPLLLLVDAFGGVATHESLIFWQVYFITAPHRWITLILVAFDHQHNGDRRILFAMIAVAIAVSCLGLLWGTGTLFCLGMVDYVWNAWHFASQHHGIFRIYQRKSVGSSHCQSMGPGQRVVERRVLYLPKIEKLFFRGFLLYVIARVAGWGWSEGPFTISSGLSWVDWWVLAVPIVLLTAEIKRCRRCGATSLGSLCYLTSLMLLFCSMLMAAHFERNQLVIQLALASAVFHSLEYLSIVTWATQRKRGIATPSVLAKLARGWGLFLAVFMLVIGVGNYLLSRGYFEVWVTVNLIVAFWHYCFDGMIWRSRKPVAKPQVGQVNG